MYVVCSGWVVGCLGGGTGGPALCLAGALWGVTCVVGVTGGDERLRGGGIWPRGAGPLFTGGSDTTDDAGDEVTDEDGVPLMLGVGLMSDGGKERPEGTTSG